ncbi:MAG: GGDEF domain-containing protein [Proteobacteria bacterium]|nr:GGDEF domain-containing protein [Pseudomonadota bacterium]
MRCCATAKRASRASSPREAVALTQPAPLSAVPSDASSPAQIAKGALRRLALEKLEPTPENYARAYRQESGGGRSSVVVPEHVLRLVERLALRAFDDESGALALGQALAQGRQDDVERALEDGPAADGAKFADLIERLVRGIERSSKQWTAARKKDSLQRVLGNGRSDARRLRQRLAQLIASWENDAPDAAAPEIGAAPTVEAEAEATAASAAASASMDDGAPAWRRVAAGFGSNVRTALPSAGDQPHVLAAELDALGARLQAETMTPALAEEAEALCKRAELVLAHRHRFVDQLGELCHELTLSLTDLAENDSWARGQCDAMRARIEEGLTPRGVRSVGELLRDTRLHQSQLRSEREKARDSLKTLIHRMLSELDELGSQTGGFHESVGRYADVIERADSLESLAGVVREMVEESRSVQALVRQTQTRLRDEHQRASALSERVAELESEMRRLSSEVSTDQLTQVANRRGLLQAFETERARLERGGATLAVGLLDIDNFKRLNDQMGHAVGDTALKSLAARVAGALRPTDHVARYGGEEFVVLLPDTPVEEGQQILTRLQRSLSVGLFMHEERQVFVTFSAGVTTYRGGERIEDALERADQALYEAKRTGKNRTCVA